MWFAAFEIDTNMACDQLSQQFLYSVMERMGYSSHWIKLKNIVLVLYLIS